MTVVSIVFAILLMTLTLASMQFSPRILISFVRDAARNGRLGFSSARSPTAWPRCRPPVRCHIRSRRWRPWWARCCWRWLCVGWLLFFIHHISQAISVNHIVDRIARETEQVIDALMPHPQRAALPPCAAGVRIRGA